MRAWLGINAEWQFRGMSGKGMLGKSAEAKTQMHRHWAPGIVSKGQRNTLSFEAKKPPFNQAVASVRASRGH